MGDIRISDRGGGRHREKGKKMKGKTARDRVKTRRKSPGLHIHNNTRKTKERGVVRPFTPTGEKRKAIRAKGTRASERLMVRARQRKKKRRGQGSGKERSWVLQRRNADRHG